MIKKQIFDIGTCKRLSHSLLLCISCCILILPIKAQQPVAGVQTSYPENKNRLREMLSGEWVPENTHKIDFFNLPKLTQSKHSIVHDVRHMGGKRVNQHNYLIYYKGKYWAMWSDGPGVPRTSPDKHANVIPGHDQAAQKVSFSTSRDGLEWNTASDITDTPKDGYGWIARGFWLRNEKLLALVSRFKAPGFAGEGLALHAFELDEKTVKWKHLGLVYDNAMNNFPPARLPDGKWMMTRRDSLRNVHLLFGGIKEYNQWETMPLLDYRRSDVSAEEPCWWVLPNNHLSALFRDNKKSGYLFRSHSSDQGRTWSDPVRTNFPDATSKFFGLRLKDGRYVLVSNPNPRKRDPMTISISDDGIMFNKMIYLVGGRLIDYPHVMEHNDHILVTFSSAKQTVEVIKISLSEMDSIQMPGTVLLAK